MRDFGATTSSHNLLLTSSFYIHTHIQSSKPLILIPASEVEDLFHEIKKKLHLLVYFPSQVREPGFVLYFDHGMPRPRFLGKLSQVESLETLEAKIPKAGYKEDDEDESVDNRSFAAFKRMMEDAVEATRNKSRSAKEKKKANRILTKQGWVSQMKRVQCYLGIRPRQALTIPVNPDTDPDVDFQHFEEAKRKYDIALCNNLPNIDLSRRVPYSYDKDVVFVCVDVEAHERANHPVTEIGISSLDTRDLRDLPPGETGKLWMRNIRSRHFRITETAHLINKDFVAGCPDRFEFGVSEWISSQDIPQTLASCFRPPFAANGNMPALADSPDDDSGNFLEKRNIIVVGHAVSTDIEYLRKAGYDVANLSNVLEAVDTANLYCAWQHEQQSTKLGSALVSLGLTGWNLHNAVSGPTRANRDWFCLIPRLGQDIANQIRRLREMMLPTRCRRWLALLLKT